MEKIEGSNIVHNLITSYHQSLCQYDLADMMKQTDEDIEDKRTNKADLKKLLVYKKKLSELTSLSQKFANRRYSFMTKEHHKIHMGNFRY